MKEEQKYRYEVDFKFAWFPVKTKKGWVWLDQYISIKRVKVDENT